MLIFLFNLVPFYSGFNILLAAINISADRQSMSNMLFDRINEPIENNSSGITGNIVFLAMNTPIAEGIPKVSTALKSTSLLKID
jgi:hypothetical protein